jgi:hypothetical protein
MYTILPYTYQQATALGVKVKPSTVKGKKIDVFKEGKKVASVGAIGYSDYPHYKQQDPQVAEKKRKNYKARHQADRTKVGSAGWYADKLLW